LSSLGLFDRKDDRTEIHQCIRYLYPHFTTVTKQHEILLQLCPKYQYFEKLLGEEKAIFFIRFACTFPKDIQQASFLITGMSIELAKLMWSSKQKNSLNGI